MFAWTPRLEDASSLADVPGAPREQLFYARVPVKPHLSASRFREHLDDSYPSKAQVLHAIEFGVGLIGSRFELRPPVQHANSFKYYADLEATRAELAVQLDAQNYILVRPGDPLPRYVAKMTSQIKVVDDTQVKFQVIMDIARRKDVLQPWAERDFNDGQRLVRPPLLRPPPFPPMLGIKMRSCFDGTGRSSCLPEGDGPNSFGDCPPMTMSSLWNFLLRVGRGWVLFAVDVSSAYRLLYMAAAERFLFGHSLDGRCYVDAACPFGSNHACYNFYAVVIFPVMHTARQRGAMTDGPVDNYVDDVFGGAPPAAGDKQLAIVHSVFNDYGIPLKIPKEQRGTSIELLGLVCDTVTMTVSVPARRRATLQALFTYVLSIRAVPVKVLQSLAGTLNWLRNAAPNLHPAFCEVRDLIRARDLSRNSFDLPLVARQELTFFRDSPGAWDVVGFFPACPSLLMSAGAADHWELVSDFPAGPLPRLLSFITSDAAGGTAQSLNVFGCVSFYPATATEAHINVEEFFAAVRAGFAAMALYLDEPRPLHVALGCDNTSAIGWLRSGLSDIPAVRQGLRLFYRFLLYAKMQISYVYVRTGDNTLADAGSRIDQAAYGAGYDTFSFRHGCPPSHSHPVSFCPRGPSFVRVHGRNGSSGAALLGSNLLREYDEGAPVCSKQACRILREAWEELLAIHGL